MLKATSVATMMETPDRKPDDSGLGRVGADALRRLIDVGSEVVSELDHETVLQRVIEAARELTGARYAASACSMPTGACWSGS